MKHNFLRFLSLTMAIVLYALCVAAEDANNKLESSLLEPNTFWGAETNGFKAGLNVEVSSGTNALMMCTPILNSSHTNTVRLYFPPLKNRYIMELTDSSGRSVKKTKAGEALCDGLTEPFGAIVGINRSAGYRALPPLDPNDAARLDGYKFSLKDFFNITNVGKYTLTLQMKVIYFPADWKGPIRPKSTNVPVLKLPPISAQIELGKPVAPSPPR